MVVLGLTTFSIMIILLLVGYLMETTNNAEKTRTAGARN